MAKQKEKEKLTPIPDFKPGRKSAKNQRQVSAVSAAGTQPDLSHIAESLRGMARPLAELAFMAGNAVDHPEQQLAELSASLKQWGQLEPLIVNQRVKPTVIGGNGRLQAMLSLGWTHAAVTVVDVDEQQAKAISLALNRTSEGRKWNAHLEQMMADVQAAPLQLDPEVTKMMERLKTEQKIGVQPIQQTGGGSPATPSVKTVVCPKCGVEFGCEKKGE
jgi:hypothetical protein